MWVEKTEKRTQKSKTFYDADTGKYQAVFTIHDQHYNNGNNWQDVDENFEDDVTPGFNKKCDKTRHAFHIANGGARRWYPRRNVDTEYVDITNMEYYTTSWHNLNLPTPVWTNNKTEWDMTNLYASITNTWKRIKTDFILKNSSTPTRLRFQVSFTGLTYNDTTGELTSTTDGLVWGYINKPFAYDANGSEENHNVTVNQSYDGTYIEWSVDTTGATFPIYVDPTFTDGYGGDVQTYKDTHIYTGAVNNNWGTSTNIVVGGDSTNQYRTLIQFNISSIPADVTLDSAALSMYCESEAAADDKTDGAYRMTVEWFEGSKNNAQPDAGENASTWNYRNWNGSVAWTTAGGDYDADVTDTDIITGIATWFNWNILADVQDWYDGVNTNYGHIFIQTSTPTDGYRKRFTSSDGATAANRPKLVVEYTIELTVQDATQAQTSGNTILNSYLITVQDSTQLQSVNKYMFVDGYGGDVETACDNDIDSSNPTANYGANNGIWVGSNWGSVHRGLFKFNISSIPDDASITSATLSLYPTYTGATSGTFTYRVFRTKRAWVELESTWNIYSTGNNWSTAGGFHVDDCEQNDIGSLAIAWNASGYQAFTLTASKTEEMLDGGSFTNNGFFIKNDTETGNTDLHAFGSSDHATTGYRPKLVVHYTAPIILTQKDSLTVQDSDQLQTVQSPYVVMGISESSLKYWKYGIPTASVDSWGTTSNGGDYWKYGIPVFRYTKSEELEVEVIEGSTSWGQATDTQEGNVRNFSGNWTGTGFISGSGNYEKMYLSSLSYMESEVVNTGANSIDLYQNRYSGGDTGVLKYRSGSTVVNCQAAEWQVYSGSFASLGYTQVRVEGS